MTSPEPWRVEGPPSPNDGASHHERHGDRRDFWMGMDQATVMSLEMLSGILLWGGLGWLVDRWLGTPFWFFGFGVALGFGAGLYLIWIRTNGTSGPARQGAAPTAQGKGHGRGGQ